jgi:hypothetical protein
MSWHGHLDRPINSKMVGQEEATVLDHRGASEQEPLLCKSKNQLVVGPGRVHQEPTYELSN